MSGVENAWMLMMSMTRGDSLPRSVPRGTLGRIWRFAAAHHRMLYAFLALTTVSAVIAVGVPVLAGRVVDAIVHRTGIGTVVTIAVAIAALAVVDSLSGLAERWMSSRIGDTS